MTIIEYMTLSRGSLPDEIELFGKINYSMNDCRISTRRISGKEILVVEYGPDPSHWESANNVEVIKGINLYK